MELLAFGDFSATKKTLRSCLNATIVSASMTDDKLRLQLADGRTLVLEDKGQNCCENRYMTCDDDLWTYAGAKLVDVELRDAPSSSSEGDVHEIQFLVVKTTKGDIVCQTHNEHNGYYGGFCVEASVVREQCTTVR